MELINLKSLNLTMEESKDITNFLAQKRDISAKKLLPTTRPNLRKNNKILTTKTQQKLIKTQQEPRKSQQELIKSQQKLIKSPKTQQELRKSQQELRKSQQELRKSQQEPRKSQKTQET